MLRTRLSSRYFGGRPEDVPAGGGVEAGRRTGLAGRADCKRQGRAVQHVAHQLGVDYRSRVRLSSIARFSFGTARQRMCILFYPPAGGCAMICVAK